MPYEPLHRLNFVHNPTRYNPHHNANPRTRVCKDCRVEYPLNAEHFYQNSVGRYTPRCKWCHNKRRKFYSHIRAAELPADAKRRRNRARQERRQRQWIAEGYPPAPRYYWTVQRAAAEIGIAPGRCYELIREGKLAATKHYKRWLRVSPGEVLRYMKEQAT